jgi:hypothetical protein
MSIEQPAGSTLTINALINKVQAALQNRDDVSESATNPEMRPSAWIRDTLREITANYEFEELKVTGPVVNIGPGLGYQGSNYAYPVSYFLNSGDDVTLTFDPVIWLTPSQAQQAGLAATNTNNSGAYSMDYMDEKSIQTILFVPGGVPFRYTRHGNQFWFGTQPGSVYQVYLPYQVRHPFSSDLPQTRIKVPPDWFDIIAFGAAERGALYLRWNEQATFIHNILYGDPLYQQSGGEEGRPGLLAARILQPERDRRLSPMTLQVGYDRY